MSARIVRTRWGWRNVDTGRWTSPPRPEKLRTRWGWRNVDTGRWTSPPRFFEGAPGRPKLKLWRYSYGLTFVEHGNYYGAIIQAWSASRSRLEVLRSELVSRLNRAVAGFTGYNDWQDWGFVKADGEGFQQVPYSRDQDGTWEWWVEDDKGRPLENEKGDLS